MVRSSSLLSSMGAGEQLQVVAVGITKVQGLARYPLVNDGTDGGHAALPKDGGCALQVTFVDGEGEVQRRAFASVLLENDHARAAPGSREKQLPPILGAQGGDDQAGQPEERVGHATPVRPERARGDAEPQGEEEVRRPARAPGPDAAGDDTRENRAAGGEDTGAREQDDGAQQEKGADAQRDERRGSEKGGSSGFAGGLGQHRGRLRQSWLGTCGWRWCGARRAGPQHAVETNGMLDVLQLLEAEILQPEVELVPDLLKDRFGNADASRVRQRLAARGDRHSVAIDPVVLD